MSGDITTPDIDQGVGPSAGVEVMIENTERESNRLKLISRRQEITNFSRVMEYMVSGGMAGVELYWDVSKFPDHYSANGFTAYTRETVAVLQNEALFTQLGDILEIGIGSGIIRLTLATLEPMLKAKPIKKIVRQTMHNEIVNRLVTKTVGGDRSRELAETGELNMLTDDEQFWTALVPWTIVKAAHSLGLISLGANDHIGAPVVFMLKGQALAAAALIITHYGSKHLPDIIDFTRKTFGNVGSLAHRTLEKTDIIVRQLENKTKNSETDIWLENANQNLDSFVAMIENWKKGLSKYDPDKVVDLLWNRIVGERGSNALSRIAVEHEVEASELSVSREEIEK